MSGKQVFFSLLAHMTTWSRVNWFLRLTDDCSLIVTWCSKFTFSQFLSSISAILPPWLSPPRYFRRPCLFMIWLKNGTKSLFKCLVICQFPEKSAFTLGTNEKKGGSGRWQIFRIILGLKFSCLSILPPSFYACHSWLNRQWPAE